jgi:hypothetical protein
VADTREAEAARNAEADEGVLVRSATSVEAASDVAVTV